MRIWSASAATNESNDARRIEVLVLTPSRDVNEIGAPGTAPGTAAEPACADAYHGREPPPPARCLLSYLLFERGFIPAN